MEERRIDLIKRERVTQQDKMIAKARLMLDSKVDNDFWEQELQTVIDERQMIIDGDNSL